jgi:predicted naringenin-chalcone synthase
VQTRYTVVPYRRALEWLPHSPDDRTAGPTTAERMNVYRQLAPPLAIEAATAALARSGVAAAQITHLISVSCTGFQAPGLDLEMMRRLGLRQTVERVQVGFMGCHGAINALRVALAIAGSQPLARVLLCAVELCSLHYQFAWNPEHMVGNALFGDGAAAVVAAATSDATSWRVAGTGSVLLPESQDAMSWSISDHGFVMQLSAQVPDLIRSRLRPWLESWLSEQGMRLKHVASWGIHPGGPRIIGAAEAALGLDERATSVSRDVLREFGNLSSPTVLFILERLMAADAPRPCVLLAFGPGLVAEAALLV